MPEATIIDPRRIEEEAAKNIAREELKRMTSVDYKNNPELKDLNSRDLEGARIRGMNNAWNNSHKNLSKPQFAVAKISSSEWRSRIKDSYLQYRLLKANVLFYELNPSVKKYLNGGDPNKPWIDQIDINKLNDNEKTELYYGLKTIEVDQVQYDGPRLREALNNKHDEFNREVNRIEAEYRERGLVVEQEPTAEPVLNINDPTVKETVGESNTATNETIVEATLAPTAEATVVQTGEAANELPIAEATVAQTDTVASNEQIKDPTSVADLSDVKAHASI